MLRKPHSFRVILGLRRRPRIQGFSFLKIRKQKSLDPRRFAARMTKVFKPRAFVPAEKCTWYSLSVTTQRACTSRFGTRVPGTFFRATAVYFGVSGALTGVGWLTSLARAADGEILKRDAIDAALLKVSDWLWLTFVTHPARSLQSMAESLTLLRVIWIVAFLCCAYGFAQIFTADLAMVFALDAASYVEVVAAITVMVIQGRTVFAARVLREWAATKARQVGAALSHLAPRARERRSSKAKRKAPPPEDHHAGWHGAPALAW